MDAIKQAKIDALAAVNDAITKVIALTELVDGTEDSIKTIGAYGYLMEAGESLSRAMATPVGR